MDPSSIFRRVDSGYGRLLDGDNLFMDCKLQSFSQPTFVKSVEKVELELSNTFDPRLATTQQSSSPSRPDTRTADDVSVCSMSSTLALSTEKRNLYSICEKWLEDNFVLDQNYAIARDDLYDTFQIHLVKHGREMKKNAFGKLFRRVFAKTTTRRLGSRGISRYHHSGVKVREDSAYKGQLAEIEDKRRFESKAKPALKNTKAKSARLPVPADRTRDTDTSQPLLKNFFRASKSLTTMYLPAEKVLEVDKILEIESPASMEFLSMFRLNDQIVDISDSSSSLFDRNSTLFPDTSNLAPSFIEPKIQPINMDFFPSIKTLLSGPLQPELDTHQSSYLNMTGLQMPLFLDLPTATSPRKRRNDGLDRPSKNL